jgi:hypothetical protein
MAELDYARYLASVYPDTTWEVDRCPHGSTNTTLRAVKMSGEAGPSSVILKHALPYFDDDGHLQPFSIKRQVSMQLCPAACWCGRE